MTAYLEPLFLIDVSLARKAETPMKKRGGQKGRQRGDSERFPYEPRIVQGKLITPVELQRIHRFVLDTSVIVAVPDDVRAVIESVWPELVYKLPPAH